MKSAALLILADLAVTAAGGSVTVSTEGGLAQAFGLCAIGGGGGGVIWLAISLSRLKDGQSIPRSLAFRSLANFLGAIPGGVGLGYLLRKWSVFAEAPAAAVFLIVSLLCGVFMVAILSRLEAHWEKLTPREFFSWILRLLLRLSPPQKRQP